MIQVLWSFIEIEIEIEIESSTTITITVEVFKIIIFTTNIPFHSIIEI